MNILFVSSEFPLDHNQATGGIGTYLLNLTKGLINQGHKVTIITKGYGVNKHKGVSVIFCNFGVTFIERVKKTLSLPLFKRFLDFIEYPILFSLESFIKINQLSKGQKIDIIEGNDFGGELFFYLLLSKKRPSVVLRLHTPSFVIQKFNQESLTSFYRFMKFLEIYCLKKADALYSPTRSLANIVSKEIDRPIKTIIPYPFTPLYSFSKVKRLSNIVLYVGKLQPKKGVFILAQAIPKVLNQFTEIKFIFVGPDTIVNGKSVKKELQYIFKRKKVIKNITFKDEVNKKELYKLYRLAIITVIPSLWENFPNVCLETISQGSIVVASRVGGLPEIITDKKNGVLFSPGNSDELSKVIIGLFKNKYLREKITVYLKTDFKKRFNFMKIIGMTENYYISLLNHNK